MSNTMFQFLKIVVIVSLAVLTSRAPGAADALGANPEYTPMTTTIEDQTELSVTIYNANMGLVKDTREVKLPRGTAALRFMDVAAQIIPSSVYIKSLKDVESLAVLEQNYEYDLLNPQKLLDKYVGKKVKLYRFNPYSEREAIDEALVLSNNGQPVFQIGDEITYGHPGRIIFPRVPEDLIAQPTLVWLLENTLKAEQKIEALYLTNGITWKADYVVTLNESDNRSDIKAWVTIDNRSGTAYRNARIKLVAGDVNRVRDESVRRDTMAYAAKSMVAEQQFKEDAFFEYHLYTLQRRSTVNNNQTKQISLMNADSVPVEKELVFRGAQHYYRSQYSAAVPNQKVMVFIRTENSRDNNLGMPLPKGTVRVYKHDNEGGLQFIGEDRIDHTPKDEMIRIKLGNAFDVTGKRKQTSWRKVARDTYEAGFEIVLKNHKKEDVTVRVIEPIPGDWEMITTSHQYKKTEAFTAEYSVPVKKDGVATVAYTVRMRF